MSERKTENLVRERLRALGFIDPDNGITVEEQKSEIAKVKALLSKASKNGAGNAGYPEFIISNQKDAGFLIVFECKPDTKKHISAARDKPIEFAVDGALHYALHLAKHYTVVAVAVSGSTASAMKTSNYLVASGSADVKELVNEAASNSLHQHLALERDHFVANLRHPNAGLGIEAFLTKTVAKYG